MTTPKPHDDINKLERREQVAIFRLRTQHTLLNAHINRFQPEKEPHCPLCSYVYETVPHFLFHCPSLDDLRTRLLPPIPTIENTLYSDKEQLRRTFEFFSMASGRRAHAQRAAGSEK